MLSDRLDASRERDAEIADAVKWWPDGFTRIDWCGPDRRWHDRKGMTAQSIDCPSYTTSLSAAASLYLDKPERIPSDPVKCCEEALKQRGL